MEYDPLEDSFEQIKRKGNGFKAFWAAIAASLIYMPTGLLLPLLAAYFANNLWLWTGFLALGSVKFGTILGHAFAL